MTYNIKNMDDYSDRNLKMARMYEGAGGKAGKTLLEVSNHFSLTRQRTHQILLKMGVKMRPRGRARGPSNDFKCRQCGQPFVSQIKKRVFCSRQCSHSAMRKYRTKPEQRALEQLRKKKAAARARNYYHNVFKKKSDWREVVRKRNVENSGKR